MYFRCNKNYAEGECPGERLQKVFNENEHLIRSGHAYISPSSFPKYLRCPAAPIREWLVGKRNDFMGDYADWYLNKGDDPTTRVLVESMREAESEATLDGTRLHELLSEILAGNDVPTMEALEDFGVSEDFRSSRLLTESFFKLANDLVSHSENGCDWWCSEVWVPLRGFNTWGTADYVAGKEDLLVIGDLKTGRQEVKAEFNEQLLGYAVGVLDTLGWDTFEQVNLQIFGVRWQGSDWLRTVEQIRDWKDNVLAPRMKECYDFHPKAKPGDHCLYCKAKLFCKEFTDIMIFRHGGGCFEDTGLEDMDSKVLVDRYLWSKQIERFQNSAKDEIALRFEGIDAIEDDRVQYVKPSPIKKYVDEEKVADYITRNIQEGSRYTKSVPSITPEEFEQLAPDSNLVETRGRRPYVKMA